MLVLDYACMDDAYHDTMQAIAENGMQYMPRGKSCIEVRPVYMTMRSPEHALYTGMSRKLSYRFWAVETLCYIAGMFDKIQAELIGQVNPKMNFVLNKELGIYDGAYGQPLLTGLPRVYNELKKDVDSRRAYISMWEHHQDMTSLDVPCTTGMQFLRDVNIHNGPALSLIVNMRSNDINWGMPYDIPAFCAIQILMARSLDLEIGCYYHNVGSMHYYEVGGSDGERPPTIEHPTKERWLCDIGIEDMTIPTPPLNCSISSVMYDARKMMKELHIHIFSRKKIADFTYTSFEKSLQEYFDRWLFFIQWDWRRYD